MLSKTVEDQSKTSKVFVCAAGSKLLEFAAVGNCRAKWHQHIKKRIGQIHGQIYKQMLQVAVFGPTSLLFSSCGCWDVLGKWTMISGWLLCCHCQARRTAGTAGDVLLSDQWSTSLTAPSGLVGTCLSSRYRVQRRCKAWACPAAQDFFTGGLLFTLLASVFRDLKNSHKIYECSSGLDTACGIAMLCVSLMSMLPSVAFCLKVGLTGYLSILFVMNRVEIV